MSPFGLSSGEHVQRGRLNKGPKYNLFIICLFFGKFDVVQH